MAAQASSVLACQPSAGVREACIAQGFPASNAVLDRFIIWLGEHRITKLWHLAGAAGVNTWRGAEDFSSEVQDFLKRVIEVHCMPF